MNKTIVISLCISISLSLSSCDSKQTVQKTAGTEAIHEKESDSLNLLTDIIPMLEDGAINAVIEIPTGTMDKWELNKSTGKVEWEMVDNKPRVVNYIGYPGNLWNDSKNLTFKRKRR